MTEVPKRLTPTSETLRKLFLLSGNECAMPDCKNVIIDNAGTMICEVAHIRAAKPDGKRFDETMSNEQRRSFENLMLLCASHHTEVDGKNSSYTADQLIDIKSKHESRFKAIENTIRKKFKTQFPDATNALEPTYPSSFERIAEIADWIELPASQSIFDRTKEFIERFSRVPETERDFLAQLVRRAKAMGWWDSWDRVAVPVFDIESALNIEKRRIGEMGQAFENYRLGSIDQNTNDQWEFCLTDPFEELSWNSIAEFCEKHSIDLDRFIVEIQFGLLD